MDLQATIEMADRRTMPANRLLAQWRVQWLIEHFTLYQSRKLSGWCIDLG
jgi:hypothetical protein